MTLELYLARHLAVPLLLEVDGEGWCHTIIPPSLVSFSNNIEAASAFLTLMPLRLLSSA